MNNNINTKSWFRNLRMKYQICLLQVIIITIIGAITISILLLNAFLVRTIIEDLNKTLLQNLQLRQLNTQSQLLETQINQQLSQGFVQLQSLNNLYKFCGTPNLQLSITTNLLKPMEIETPLFNSTYFQSFPYFAYQQSNSSDKVSLPTIQSTQQLVSTTGLANQLLMPFQFYDPVVIKLYYTTTDKNQFFAMFPAPVLNVSRNYYPHRRPWYKEHIQNFKVNPNQDFVISDPYLSYSNTSIALTITRSINNDIQELDGVAAFDSTLFDTDQFEKYNFINTFIIGIDGQLFVTNANITITNFISDQINYYIYEENITGLDMDDWTQILNQYLYQNGTSDCIVQSNVFCRYNTLFQQNIQVNLQKFTSKFYILTYVDMTYIFENQTLSQIIIIKLLKEFSQSLIILGTFSACVVLIAYIYMIIFIKPYSQFTQTLQQSFRNDNLYQMEKQTHSQKLNKFQKIGFGQFSRKLFEMKNKKSKECCIIEKFQFPRQCNDSITQFLTQELFSMQDMEEYSPNSSSKRKYCNIDPKISQQEIQLNDCRDQYKNLLKKIFLTKRRISYRKL